MTKAVFSDVEGTLIDGSLPRMFVKTGARLGVFAKWKLAGAVLLNGIARPFPSSSRANTALRFAALRLLMKGMSVETNLHIIEETVPALLKAVKPATLARLRQHQADGQAIVLVSAGLHEAITRIAQEFGARGEGTQVEEQAGVYTGRGQKPCQGYAKAARVREVAREQGVDLAQAVGYGDTFSDVPFLALMGKAVVVDPAPKLKAEAERRGWEILITTHASTTMQTTNA